jgi:hypothetical protein
MSHCCLQGVAQHGGQYESAYGALLGNTTPSTKALNCLTKIVALALLVIGCVGIFHLFPESIMGWSVIGIGGLYLALKLLPGRFGERKIDLIFAAFIATCCFTFGILGGLRILQDSYVGYALLGCLGLTALLTLPLMVYAKRTQPHIEEEQSVKPDANEEQSVKPDAKEEQSAASNTKKRQSTASKERESVSHEKTRQETSSGEGSEE